MKIAMKSGSRFAVRGSVLEASAPASRASTLRGILIHLGPIVGTLVWLSLTEFTLVNVLASTFTMSFAGAGVTWILAQHAPSVELPAVERRTAINAFFIDILLKGYGIGLAVLFSLWGLASLIGPDHLTHHGVIRSLGTLLLADAAYYSLHRWVFHTNGGPAWVRRIRGWGLKEHWVHHRVEHLDFLRGNIGSWFDNGIISFPLPTALVAAAMGLDLPATLLVYQILMMAQITHHANTDCPLGPLQYVFLSDTAHKMHHCRQGHLVNFGCLFACWDRLGGTYYEGQGVNPAEHHLRRKPLPIRRG